MQEFPTTSLARYLNLKSRAVDSFERFVSADAFFSNVKRQSAELHGKGPEESPVQEDGNGLNFSVRQFDKLEVQIWDDMV